jgi:uncharacterized protein DUF3465
MGKSEQRKYGKVDSGTWIEGYGSVRRLLSDDNEGAQHQLFILDRRNGQTILIAHNIDLARRVPLGMGDRVHYRGMYEWNDQGGLVHWTHHDPVDATPGGYIRFRNKVYA